MNAKAVELLLLARKALGCVYPFGNTASTCDCWPCVTRRRIDDFVAGYEAGKEDR